ncbi:MAG: hypothetical protein O3C22_00495 [Bacteroidetes bacterium]|jgi:hypothetical protein|nr:hypothetical protein [Bacteroidota bacterium]MDA0942972.1 hypothetical protein [Bacteroidota bacterium]MDA1111656.1 hypothetical protein [Bacteroidota bacterium]
MNKQQRAKLAVGLTFIALITGISIWAHFSILKPIRENRTQREGKHTLKRGYKTQYNPDFIDSVMEAKQSEKGLD